MESLKKAIKDAVEKTGIDTALKQESAVFLWNDIVGEVVAGVTETTGVEKGVLTVKTSSPTWRQELHMQKNEILDKINKKIGSKAIKEIRFI
jgi:predicted nucleic acid-binding Zn ribbon protein